MVDASAVVEFLLRTSIGRKLSPKIAEDGTDLHVPALCDVEVAAALGGLKRRKELKTARALEALDDYLDLPLVRHGHRVLLARAFALRQNFSSYDAMYVALAEGLGADFLTADDHLKSAVAAWTDIDKPSRMRSAMPQMKETFWEWVMGKRRSRVVYATGERQNRLLPGERPASSVAFTARPLLALRARPCCARCSDLLIPPRFRLEPWTVV